MSSGDQMSPCTVCGKLGHWESAHAGDYNNMVDLEHKVVELIQHVYMPGDWKCDKCGFEQSNRTLHASTGDITAPRLEEIQKCPNDGQTMRRITWKEGCEANYQSAVEIRQREQKLRLSLAETASFALRGYSKNINKDLLDQNKLLDLYREASETIAELAGVDAPTGTADDFHPIVLALNEERQP